MLGVLIEDYRFQVFINMSHYETNKDWTALSTVRTYACRQTKVISLCFPCNQVASLDMVPDYKPCRGHRFCNQSFVIHRLLITRFVRKPSHR